MKIVKILSILGLLVSFTLHGQNVDSSQKTSPYRVNLKKEFIPYGLAGALVCYGNTKIASNSQLSATEALALNKNNVNRFDRPVLNFPASRYNEATKISNNIMYGSTAIPALLMLDKNIRKDWKSITTMYFETHIAGSGTYTASTFLFKRARPMCYNPDWPIEKRSGLGTNNSFFSGHVETTAASTFFMAQVLVDYHDFNIWQKSLVYIGAAIPPIVVANYRMRAGKHFRTDVMSGFAVGATVGILTPILHRKHKDNTVGFTPYYSDQTFGVNFRYRIK